MNMSRTNSMNKIMIKGLVAIGYKDIFDDYDQIDPKQLLEDVPTMGALDMVVFYQNKTIFAFADLEMHREIVEKMRSCMDEQSQSRIDALRNKHPDIALFSADGCFLFFKLALECYNPSNRELNNEDKVKIFKAYLYCNQLWTDKASENIDPQDVPGLFIRVDLPIVEFKLYKDFKVQMYKAKEFFKYCEQDELFRPFLDLFCKDHLVTSWKDYLLTWFNFLQSSIQTQWVKFEGESEKYILFFDQYAINPTDCAQIWSSNDQFYLRDHFLYSPQRGVYLLLNHNLMVDKFYQGMKFDFAKSVIGHECVNEHGKPIDNIPQVNSIIGDRISESRLFYSLMHKAFDGFYDAIFEGETMKLIFENNAEPDFYMRRGNHVFLFEYKDLTLGEPVKFSDDLAFIKKEVVRRICKGGSNNRKGGGQLLYSMNAIMNDKKMHPLDTEAENADMIFPIIVTTDRAFSAMGINYMIIPEFSQLARQYKMNTHIAPVVIMDYDTLFMLCNQLHEGKLDLETIINAYTSKLLNSPNGIDFISSFYTFAYDEYRQIEETEEQLNYVLGDLVKDLAEISDTSKV